MAVSRYILSIILCLSLFTATAYGGEISSEIDSLMHSLEVILEKRSDYVAAKEKKLHDLRLKADSTRDDRERFYALGHLMDEFLSFNTDSAYSICVQRENIAARLGDATMMVNARMNRADIYNATAMYKETVSLMDSVSYSSLPDYLRPYYFHIKRTVYGRLADFAAFPEDRNRYMLLTDMYRDSLLSVNDPNKLPYVITCADKLNAEGRPHDALKTLENYCRQNSLSEHDQAIFAWTRYESYLRIGDRDMQKRELLLSSISDIRSSVREYVSLRQLAVMLYQEGDLERAYRFMTIAVDDAAKCNARQRIVELSDFYPMINDIYVNKIRSQKKALAWTIMIITVLTLFLLVLLIYTRKQMRRVAEARKSIQKAYENVHALNHELQESNRKLHEANQKLHEANCDIAEISRLKEVYIGRYMDQCLAYIDKLDTYRKSLGKLLNSGKAEELKKTLKSTDAIDSEFKAFYDQFDKTFLSIFPNFVEEFNSLLMPEEAIVPKKEGSLNTELRIFALIRLGITDSDSIAKFLRYSLTTIYNYRTKVRNKAKGDRNMLEKEVSSIGRC